MEARPYPVSLSELDAWRRAYGTTSAEARQRFVQFVLLDSIAAMPSLSHLLAFKGGNALRFVYGNRRSTLDLDFSATSAFPDDPAAIRSLLDNAFALGSRRFGIRARCQRLRRNPPGAEKTFPTYLVNVGYQLPSDLHFADIESTNVSTTVLIEISINDVICEAGSAAMGGEPASQVHVCALEDILAEKLRALLQQPIRKRNRRQDVYDIARMIRLHGSSLDRRKIASFLVQKAAARSIAPRKLSFNDIVRRYAAYEYDSLFGATDPDSIPFDEAWTAVTDLVAALDIPD